MKKISCYVLALSLAAVAACEGSVALAEESTTSAGATVQQGSNGASAGTSAGVNANAGFKKPPLPSIDAKLKAEANANFKKPEGNFGSQVSGINRETEAKIQALKKEMEDKIAKIREEYRIKIDALMKSSKNQKQELKTEKKEGRPGQEQKKPVIQPLKPLLNINNRVDIKTGASASTNGNSASTSVSGSAATQ